MSTLKVTSIQKTGETASRDVRGVAAASLNYKGTSTNSIRYSLNVSSVSDDGVGSYTTNFSSNMSSANYTVTCAQGGDTNNDEVRVPQNGGVLAASDFSVTTLNVGVAISDVTYLFETVHGDLA